MAKKPANHGKDWTRSDIKNLEKLVDQNTPTRVIALKLQRTPRRGSAEGERGKHFLKTDQSVAL